MGLWAARTLNLTSWEKNVQGKLLAQAQSCRVGLTGPYVHSFNSYFEHVIYVGPGVGDATLNKKWARYLSSWG